MTRRTGIALANFTRKVRVVWLFVVGSMILAACTAAPPPSEADEIAIYAAVVRQLYTQDDTFGGNLKPPIVYIVPKTFDGEDASDFEPSEPQVLSEATQAGISQALADLPTRVVWISDRTQVPRDPATDAVADRGAIVTLGNIHVQKDGSVLVANSIYIAPLAAGGQTYVVERVDGAWTVTGNTGVVWMS